MSETIYVDAADLLRAMAREKAAERRLEEAHRQLDSALKEYQAEAASLALVRSRLASRLGVVV